MKWVEVYKNKINEVGIEQYIKNKVKYKKEYIKIIEKYAINKTILETGCGTGIISLYFAKNGYHVVALDNDINMINLAKYIANLERKRVNNLEYTQQNLLNCKFTKQFDVAFSNGVYEHFNNKEIINMIENIFNYCKYNIISVPTKFFNKKEAIYGNERFMSKKDWLGIFNSANLRVVEIKRFDDRTFLKKVLQINKWFKNKPFIIFVLQKN